MPQPPESIVIVGPGRTGTSLAKLWQDAGQRIAALVGGSLESHARARSVLRSEVPVISHDAALGSGTLVVVAVPDGRIDEAVQQLGAGQIPASPPLVIHVAGSRGKDALAPLAKRGVPTAAFHPLRAFPTREPNVRGLTGALCAIECETPMKERLTALAKGPGGVPVFLSPSDRALYHAGAAVAGNAVLALLDLALRCFEKAGVPTDLALPSLIDLAKGALDNAAAHGPVAALTGPVVRGDRTVLARHLEALDAYSPVDRRFYWALARALIRLSSHRQDGWKALSVADLSAELDA